MTKEIWKNVIGYEGKYLVSSEGRIYSLLTDRLRKPCRAGKVGQEYMQIHFGKGKFKKIHRMVLEAFLEPSNLEVNHKDFNQKNNKLSNLEYVTSSENKRHMIENGRHNKAILGISEVIEIRTLLSKKISPDEIAKKYKISISTVSNIKIRKTWKWL